MAEFTLRPHEEKTLRLNIGEDSFQIPLAGSLTPDEVVKLETQAGTIEFFRKYIAEEIATSLKVDDWNAITNAWVSASKKAAKKAPGES